jgi:predicted house-cleaning noncanonical NTP pyrophosphatase (MazG superfamily)
MSTKIYNKLVRDRIPEIIRANGETPVTRILGDKEYLSELIRKLDEEVSEFKADLSVEELADIQEVVLALADAIANRNELEKIRARKAKTRGALQDKVFLESAQTEERQ